MLLILLTLCLRKSYGVSHLFSIAYAFAGNRCEAEDLALHKAFTAHAGPTLWAAGPRRRTTGTFGQGRFDQMAGEDTRQGPGRQDQLGECVGLFNRAEQALHAGIIIAYAVAEV